jgi:drug/metabolite transporter (DMT)-like permease
LLAQVVMIYLSVITTLVVAVYTLVYPAQVPSWDTIVNAAPALFAVGLSGWLNQLCITMGLARAPAAKATAMGYLSVVFAAAADFLLFGISTSPMTAVGGLIIVWSAILVAIYR